MNVMDIYEKRKERPVMISFAKGLTPTFEIPFPAVTICPEANLCGSDDFENLIETHVNSTMKNSSNAINEIFDRCRYQSRQFDDCKQHFSKVITDEGVCWTFNMLDQNDLFHNNTIAPYMKLPNHGKPSDWFLEKDYESSKLKVYPHRVIGSGIQSGLLVDLKMKKSEMCMKGVQGFRLSLHTPAEVPQVSKDFYSIPLQKQTTVSVKPHMIYSSKNIKDYDPNSRQCFLKHEKKLKFYKVYAKSSCELECLTEKTLFSCGCVKFSMPHDNHTKVCDSSKLDCVYEADHNYTINELEYKLLKKQLKIDLKHGRITQGDEKFKQLKHMQSCNCLPSCTSLRYDAVISQTDLNENDDQE